MAAKFETDDTSTLIDGDDEGERVVQSQSTSLTEGARTTHSPAAPIFSPNTTTTSLVNEFSQLLRLKNGVEIGT